MVIDLVNEDSHQVSYCDKGESSFILSFRNSFLRENDCLCYRQFAEKVFGNCFKMFPSQGTV